MPNYDIDWEYLVADMLPAVLRRPRTLAFLAALLSPLAGLQARFSGFRQQIATELPIGPEVAVLRHYLNNNYDGIERRIRILDGQVAEPLRIFTDAENQPIYLPVFLSAQRIDFTVEIPATLQSFEADIRRFLDRYKLPTKTYRIIYV